MKIIGCDIGYKNLGFAVVDSEKSRLELLYAENFVTIGKTLTENLIEIATQFKTLVKTYQPDTYVFEDPVMHGATGAKLNEVVGVLKYLAAKYQLTEFSYKPTQVKLEIFGSGKAEKKDIIAAVEAVFPERKFTQKENHCADATAVCLCHLFKTTGIAWEFESHGVLTRE